MQRMPGTASITYNNHEATVNYISHMNRTAI